ncbi:unnamed protein product [Moneuplotes crassus]|uniref:Uncharacterized protein n=1 Tax=Euplotes crassus TaxID=5936 RepID=A0AAD2DBL9_EUPCR|nr:unnamed protein product [Moneuplotes crassus]
MVRLIFGLGMDASVPLSNMSYEDEDSRELLPVVISENMIAEGLYQSDKKEFEGDPGLISFGEAEMTPQRLFPDVGWNIERFQTEKQDLYLNYRKEIKQDYLAESQLLTIEQAIRLAKADGYHTEHIYGKDSQDEHDPQEDFDSEYPNQEEYTDAYSMNKRENGKNQFDIASFYHQTEAGPQNYEKELVPRLKHLQPTIRRKNTIPKPIPRICRRHPVHEKEIRPKLKKSDAAKIHEKFVQRTNIWKKSRENKNIKNYATKTEKELDACSFRPKINSYKPDLNSTISYQGEQRKKERVASYKRELEQECTFKPRVNNVLGNDEVKSKYWSLTKKVIKNKGNFSVHSSQMSEKENVIHLGQVRKVREKSIEKPGEDVFERLSKPKEFLSIDHLLYDIQQMPNTTRNNNYKPKLDFWERQDKLQEKKLKYAQLSELNYEQKESEEILQSKNPYKDSYTGYENREAEEMTFQPQISKLAQKQKELREGDIHERLYQLNSKSEIEKAQDPDQIHQRHPDEPIFSFQPEINADSETFSRYMESYANYKQKLQDRDRIMKTNELDQQTQELVECTHKPQTIELPTFIQDYLSKTKDFREAKKELQELCKEEEKPRWVYN